MTRMSKKGERRARCHKKNKMPSLKTGQKTDKLKLGFKERANALSQASKHIFIAKIK